jgi:hypothetical protein
VNFEFLKRTTLGAAIINSLRGVAYNIKQA